MNSQVKERTPARFPWHKDKEPSRMKLTLIQPTIGRVNNRKVNRRRVIEPLSVATIAGLAPEGVEKEFFDERLEEIDFDTETDLVGITTETLNARRAYEISREFRKRGVPVVLGGFHPSLVPEEAVKHADSIVIGQAEDVWKNVIEDARNHRLQPQYERASFPAFGESLPDRSIYRGKNYLPVRLMEFGRGCSFRCDFCSVHNFFGDRYATRSVDSLIAEIEGAGHKNILFVDDNLFSDRKKLETICRRLIPLNIRWVGQASISIARDERALDLIVESGCKGLLIGFESIHPEALQEMNKRFNGGVEKYREAIRKIKSRQLKIYGSFVIGYDHETRESIRETVDFAIGQKLTIATFYPLTPFPGTRLYERLKEENRLIRAPWWLDPDFRYGDIFFSPRNMHAEELAEMCVQARKKFYRPSSILSRALDFRGNVHNPGSFYFYLLSNILVNRDIDLKNRTQFGLEADGQGAAAA
jgi:radical SAM superfamily enzyme YgiQ (UPF0313 family)